MEKAIIDRFRGAILAVTERSLALYGLAVVRILIGVAQLSHYLSDYADRRQVFGPEGIYPRSEVDVLAGANAYIRSGDSLLAFEVVYHLGILACVAMVLGVGGRFSLALAYYLCWSLWNVNPMIIDGGDNLSMIVMAALLLTNCCSVITLRLKNVPQSRLLRWPEKTWIGALINNAGVLIILLQVCLVYFLAGIYKFQGQMWIDGTALYYIMNVPEFHNPALSPLVLGSDTVIVLSTWAAMVLLTGFPFLVISRSTRRWAALLMIGFHLSIALMMNLTSFALIMAACDMLFVSDDVERSIRKLKEKVVSRARAADAPIA